MVVIAIAALVALFMIGNGSLLAFWPKRFLRFYDVWSCGDYVGRTGSWRNNVERLGYRRLGLGIVVGIAMFCEIVKICCSA
jgi:hypothetical protein